MSVERWESWAPRAQQGLARLPEAVADRLQTRRRHLVAAAARRAPRRTGALARSLRGTVDLDSRNRVSLSLWTEHPAAAALDQGARIRARRRSLTVPIGGVTMPARSAVGAFVLRARDGRRFLARREGGGLRLMFRLMEEVTIRGSGYATAAFEAEAAALPDQVDAVVDAEVA